MKKYNLTALFIVPWLLLSTATALAGYCIVDKADDNSNLHTLEDAIGVLNKGANCKPPQPEKTENNPNQVGDYDLFDQAVFFTLSAAKKITLGQTLTINNGSKIVIGNFGKSVVDDVTAEIDYENTHKEYKEVFSLVEGGMITIDGSQLGEGKSPFVCGNKAKNVYLRNVKLITNSVEREALPSCIKNGGNFLVEPIYIKSSGLKNAEVCTLIMVKDEEFDIHVYKYDCNNPNCSEKPQCKNKVSMPDVPKNDCMSKNNVDCTRSECVYLPNCEEGAELTMSGFTDLNDACSDNEDNDNDGTTDCEDTDCVETDVCLDENNDICLPERNGQPDCTDPKCANDPVCLCTIDPNDPSCPEEEKPKETICDDGLDNDEDGPVDEEDIDCHLPEEPQAEICENGENDDDDTWIDCDDPDCFNDKACEDDTPIDGDGDGFLPPNDCDDDNKDIHPGAKEICGDGVDNNCDGKVDYGCNGDPDVDDDGDGFSEDQGDCDDNDPLINPDATEICGNNFDENCDGKLGGVPSVGVTPAGGGSTPAALFKQLYKSQSDDDPEFCVDPGQSKGQGGGGGGGCGCDIGQKNRVPVNALILFGFMVLCPLSCIILLRKTAGRK